MKRLWTALLTLATLGVARASDIATTLHFSPDLAREGNPLAAWFGMDLTSLLVVNILGLLVLVVCPLAVYCCRGPAVLDRPAATLREYVSLQLHGQTMPIVPFLGMILLHFPVPKNRIQLLRVLGLALAWGLIAASFSAVFAWWATYGWPWPAYIGFRRSLSIPGLPLLEGLVGVAAFWLAALLHYRSEFWELRQKGKGRRG
jgi:hypothetical protein